MGLNKILSLALIIQSFIILEVRLETENKHPVRTQSYAVDLIEETIKQISYSKRQHNPSEVAPSRVTGNVLAFDLDDRFKQTVQNPPISHSKIPSSKDQRIRSFSGDVIAVQSSADVANTGSDLEVSTVASFETKIRNGGIDNFKSLNISTSIDSKVTRYVQSYINQSQTNSYSNGFVALDKLPFKTSNLIRNLTNLTENLRPKTYGRDITKHTSDEVSKHGAESLIDKTSSITGFDDYDNFLWNDPTLFSNRFKRQSLINNDTGHNYSFELRKVVLYDQEMATAESGFRNSSSSKKLTQNLTHAQPSWNTSSNNSESETNYESLFQYSVTNYDLLTDYTTKSPIWERNISTLAKPSTKSLKTSGTVFKLPLGPSLSNNTVQSTLSSSATPSTSVHTPTPSPLTPSTSRHSLATSTIPKPSPTSDPWPVKLAAETHGDLILGGLMMVHEREDSVTCGPIMPQGGIQALETMLYTLDVINSMPDAPFTLGAHILDDCDKDTYGLEMAVDFIKGEKRFVFCRV